MTDEHAIHNDLAKIAEKYGITKGILLMEQKEPVDKGRSKERVIIFAPDMTEPDIHLFGQMYFNCIKISKTFREIVNHIARHMIEEAVSLADLTEKGIKAD